MNCLKWLFYELYFSEYYGSTATVKTEEGDK